MIQMSKWGFSNAKPLGLISNYEDVSELLLLIPSPNINFVFGELDLRLLSAFLCCVCGFWRKFEWLQP